MIPQVYLVWHNTRFPERFGVSSNDVSCPVASRTETNPLPCRPRPRYRAMKGLAESKSLPVQVTYTAGLVNLFFFKF